MNTSSSFHPGQAAYRRCRQLLSEVLAPSTFSFLQKANIQKGMKGLNLNCGLGEVAVYLANLVGEEGSITGVDQGSFYIEQANTKTRQQGRKNLSFYVAEEMIYDQVMDFDFIYAPFLFSDSTLPQELARHIKECLKPGSLILAEEIHLNKHYSFPYSFAFNRYIELLSAATTQDNGNPNIGSSLPQLLADIGFQKREAAILPRIFLSGEQKQISSLCLESIGAKILKNQLVSPLELNALIEELKHFERLPETISSLPGVYQIQGFKN